MHNRWSVLKNIALNACLVIVFILNSNSVSAVCSRTITVGWEVWEPFQYQDKFQEYTGLDFDLFRAVMVKAGCKFTFAEMPWKRIITEMDVGGIDAVIGASKTKERMEIGYFSKPFRYEKMVMFVRKGELQKYPQRTFDEFFVSQFSLGATLGYAYGDVYERALNKYPEYRAKLSIVQSDAQNYDMLLFGRIDGFLGERHHVSYDLKKKGKFHLVDIHPLEVRSGDIFVMFSKKNVPAEFVNSFNAALKSIRASGEYDKVVYQYLQ